MDRSIKYWLICFTLVIISCGSNKKPSSGKIQDEIELDGIISFYFLLDTVYTGLSSDLNKNWLIGATYIREDSESTFFYNNSMIKAFNRKCIFNSFVTENYEYIDLMKSEIFASQDSIKKHQWPIYFSENIYDTENPYYRVISFQLKGSGYLINNLCDNLEDMIKKPLNCKGPESSLISPFIFLKKMDSIQKLKPVQIKTLGYKKSKIKFIDTFFCE